MSRSALILISLLAWLPVFGLEREKEAEEACRRPFRFVQLTDLHISADCVNEPECPARNFTSAVDEINRASPPPAFVLVTGDIAERLPGAYEMFGAAARRLTVPLHVVPGNHDDPALLRRAAGLSSDHFFHSFSYCGLFVVLLDSKKVDDEFSGELGERQRAWMIGELAAHRDSPTLIFMHHHVVPAGTEADRFMLTDRAAFLAAIDGFPQVRAVISGHAHLSRIERVGVRYFVNTPALSYGIFGSDRSPGYRIVEISPSGAIKTFDKRLGKNAIEQPPPDA